MDLTELAEQARVWHHEYGRGTVMTISNESITMFWDTPHPGTNTRQMTHPRAFAEQLQQVPDMGRGWPELKSSDPH